VLRIVRERGLEERNYIDPSESQTKLRAYLQLAVEGKVLAMKNLLRKLLRSIVPYGAVDWFSKWRKLRDLGYDGPAWNYADVSRTCWSAHRAGFDLLPEGSFPLLSTLVDVGANRGQWLESALRCVNPDHVVAVEPEPSAYTALQKKYGEERGVDLHNVAAGKEEDSVELRITNSNQLSSILKRIILCPTFWGSIQK